MGCGNMDVPVGQMALLIGFAIMIIGVIMAIKWKRRNFLGSPSKGIGRDPFRRKPHDFDDDAVGPPKC